MGRHARPSKAASLAAGTAPAAIAAGALFVAPAAHAQVITPQRTDPVTTVTTPDAIYKPVIHQTVARAVALSFITVHPGNSLSSLAGFWCHNPADWSGIAGANRSQVKNPNVIYPDEKLVLDCRTDSTVRLPVVHSVVNVSTTSESVPVYHHHHHNYSSPSSIGGTYHGSGGMQQCIISRESGGNSQVMNSSGHYGLYQFSASTWAGHGGSSADFGHASVAEQNQVYYNTVAADGYSDWAPYDGC